jgi:uncharacterized protein YggU (UPF0235/DUF167 family)
MKKNCQILLKFSPNNDENKTVEFEIFGTRENGSANGYVAMSLSPSSKMNGSVTVCALVNSTKVILINGVNYDYIPKRIGEVVGINLDKSDFTNGLYRCKWKRNSVTHIDGVEYNMENTSYFIQLAKGNWNTVNGNII